MREYSWPSMKSGFLCLIYSNKAPRLNTLVNITICALTSKELFDHSDDEMAENH